jgi:Mor family transcriptional regulator
MLSQRNLEIYWRHTEGERAVELAKEYCVTWQRIYQIIRQVKEFMEL